MNWKSDELEIYGNCRTNHAHDHHSQTGIKDEFNQQLLQMFAQADWRGRRRRVRGLGQAEVATGQGKPDHIRDERPRKEDEGSVNFLCSVKKAQTKLTFLLLM